VGKKGNDMSHRILERRFRCAGIASLVVGATLVAAGGPAHAEPVAGCGKDWQLLTIDETVQFIYDATKSVQAQRDADPGWRTTTYGVFSEFDQAFRRHLWIDLGVGGDGLGEVTLSHRSSAAGSRALSLVAARHSSADAPCVPTFQCLGSRHPTRPHDR
jgi:hypothetical protein